MATRALNKKPVVNKFQTIAEQIADLVKKHIVTTTGIVKSYDFMSEAGLETDLQAENDKLLEAVEDFDNETDAEKFRQLIGELELIDSDDFDAEKVIELLEAKGFKSEALLKLIDADDLESYFVNEGYACIKINNLADRQKLEEFVTTQIYPLHSDQQSFLII